MSTTDVKKIILCSQANKAAVAAALIGIPGGGIANFSIPLAITANDPDGLGPATWWGGSGLLPTEMVAVLGANPTLVDMYATDGSAATFYGVLASHSPALTRIFPQE